MDTKKATDETLKLLRLQARLKQREVAGRYNTNQRRVSDWERGVSKVPKGYKEWLKQQANQNKHQGFLTPKEAEELKNENKKLKAKLEAEKGVGWKSKYIEQLEEREKDRNLMQDVYSRLSEVEDKYAELLHENSKLKLLRQRDEALIVELRGKAERKSWKFWEVF